MKISDIVFRLMQCREAQEAASREMDGRLGWISKGLLRWHCRYCWCCRNFTDQLRVLRHLLRAVSEVEDFGGREILSPQGRERIRQALREACRNDPDHPV